MPRRLVSARACALVAVSLALPVAACGHAASQAPARSVKTASDASHASSEQSAKLDAEERRAIDATLRDEWKRANVEPAARADDATFLRRAYVDVVGSVPPVLVTTTFLADT